MRVSGDCVSQISSHSTYACGNVVSPTPRPPIPPGNIAGINFC